MITLADIDKQFEAKGFKRSGMLFLAEDKFILEYANKLEARQTFHVLYLHRRDVKVFQEIEIKSIIPVSYCDECGQPGDRMRMFATGFRDGTVAFLCKNCLWDEKTRTPPRQKKQKDRTKIRNRRK